MAGAEGAAGGPLPLPDGLAAPLEALAASVMGDGLLAGLAYALLLVFARIGTAAMLLPGVGELWVPARVRLAFALGLTLTVLPALLGRLPPPPPGTGGLLLAIGQETLVGLFLGGCVRASVSAALVAGSAAALQAGFANALQPGMVNPDAADILGVGLGLAVVALIANSGLDHLVLRAVLESYALIPPPGTGDGAAAGVAGAMSLPLDRLAWAAARTVADAFALGLWVAFPVLVATLLVNLGLGLANRFMQQLQAYFLSVPIAAAVGLALLALGAPAILAALAGGVERTLLGLGGAG